MKITEIIIENFLTIGSINARLDGRGLVLIQGENVDDTSQDSNGSGKSSFPDALSWCLYGVTARGETGDSVINRTAGKGCSVTVLLEDGDELYKIVRHRKHPKGKNRLWAFKFDNMDGAYDDLTKGTDKLTQPVVNKIIGSSVDVFNAAIYAAQDKTPDLPGMTDKFLKQLVEESAGIDRLQSAHFVAKGRLDTVKKRLAEAFEQLNKCRSKSSVLGDSLESVEKLHKAWDDDHASDTKACADKIRTQQDKVKEREAEVDRPAMIAVGNDIAEAKGRISAVDSEREKESELSALKSKFDRETAKAETGFSSELKKLKVLKHAHDHVLDKVGEPCESCGKEHKAEDMTEASRIAASRLDEQKLVCVDKKKHLESTREKLSTAAEELSAFKASMTDTSEQLAAIERLEAKANDLQTKVDAVTVANDALKSLAAELKRMKAETNPHTDTLNRLNDQINEVRSESESVEVEIKEIEANLALQEDAVRCFGPGGVRAYILDTVTPFLNSRTAHYLGTLSDGNLSAVWTTLSLTKGGEVRERFAIEVSSKVGGGTFGGLSGGEKRKVRLACAMALQDLVASRATKPIELWIADEIDHALDESGLERLMIILDEKARDKGTVLTISHNSLSDWIRQTVTVKKEGGFSTMIGTALA